MSIKHVISDSAFGAPKPGFALKSKFICDNYNEQLENIKIPVDKLDELLDEIKTFLKTSYYEWDGIEGDKNIFVFRLSNIYIEITYRIGKSVQLDMYSNSIDFLKGFYNNILKKYITGTDELLIKIKSFYEEKGELVYVDSSKTKDNYKNIDYDYYPFLDLNEMFIQFLFANSNILILYGQPGTGKTKLAECYLNFLLNLDYKKYKHLELEEKVFDKSDDDCNCINVAVVKNESLLAGDAFWNELLANRYNLVLFDDLDYLLPRSDIQNGIDAQRNQFMSHFLSFTEGINNDITCKTKFIITTNRNINEIDPALLRAGRTFDILNLRTLTKKEALKIWENNGLPKKSFNKLINDNILQCNLSNIIEGEKYNIACKNNFKNYLKENDISHMKNINNKKIGLI
ncbi:putative AAA/AAA+ superfamily ATPase [Campylobacter phage F207]|uniref:Putative AAA/AAA+ superfamily ATPase n=1 Tax=Campylobacter phage F207 TaxID=2794360 RepID=A0A7T3N3T7_9CAUD|nr:putative AAA/AAA+ superfamily ATPase [Campylobacter phage F207]